MSERLSKFLARSGIASRRACEHIIAEGRVCVNGERVLLPQTLVCEQDEVLLEGKKISKEEKRSFLFHKPCGYECSHVAKRAVVDFFKDIPLRLFTVGRLDIDSSGLIIVSNDGALAHSIMHPSSGVDKEYLVTTRETLHDEHFRALRKGMYMDGSFVQPKAVRRLPKEQIRITLGEGKNREVRRLFAHCSLRVRMLRRIRIGPLWLHPLKVGERLELPAEEWKKLFPQKAQES